MFHLCMHPVGHRNKIRHYVLIPQQEIMFCCYLNSFGVKSLHISVLKIKSWTNIWISAEKPISSIPSKQCTNLIFTWTVTYSSSWSELHHVKAAQIWGPGSWTPWKHKYKKIQADCRFSTDTDSATLLVGHTWWWRWLFVKVLWSPFFRDDVLYTSLLDNTTCYIISFFRCLHSTASLHTLSPLLALPVQPVWPASHVN